MKSRKGKDVALVLIVMLTGALSFGLGRLSAGPEHSAAAALYTVAPPETGTTAQGIAAEEPVSAVAEQGAYVASKNGSVYHLPWCSGAKRIRDENKVWFDTKTEAEAAGYRPAANCKGL